MTHAHPAGLRTLFFAEMWERFSFYGMRALLVLYLVSVLELPREQALQVYATYTGLVYLTPILGGYLADRWLGARRAVLIGGIVMALGHFAMAFPELLYPALGLLVVGNGFFKPNISTMVGRLYAQGDSRRDSGFTLFYLGINLGAFLSPFVCGTLGEVYGWHYGFGAAGVGMLLGLGVFLHGQGRLGTAGLPPARAGGAAALRAEDWVTVGAVVFACAAFVFGFVAAWPVLRHGWQSLSHFGQGSTALALALAALAAPRWLARERPAPLAREERDRIVAILVIALFVIFFWMGFEQAGGTMNLFAYQLTDRVVFGMEIPASWFQAVNPLLIIALAPLFAGLWARLDRSPRAPSSVVKQALGILVLGLGFVVLAVGHERALLHGKVGPEWLLGAYALFTVGELFLSPIGLSMVTKLAPARFVSLLMGLWFAAIAAASYLAGILESLVAPAGIPLYWFLTGSSLGAGLLLLLLAPFIHRLMHGVR